jgi:hypothetical protein
MPNYIVFDLSPSLQQGKKRGDSKQDKDQKTKMYNEWQAQDLIIGYFLKHLLTSPLSHRYNPCYKHLEKNNQRMKYFLTSLSHHRIREPSFLPHILYCIKPMNKET